MTINSDKLGYVRIDITGYSVTEWLGSGAVSKVLKGIPLGDKAIVTEIPQNDEALPDTYAIHEVDDDGNCLFRAIAHQLQLAGIRDPINEELYNHETLRAFAVSQVEADARFRIMMHDEEFIDLSRLTGYVNHGSIAALANALNVNITIFGASGRQPVTINADGLVVQANIAVTVDRPHLRILYNGVNHYNSVIERTVEDHASRKRHASSVLAGPRKKVKTEQQLPVAIKIFEVRHKQMRNNELEILDKLKFNNNVPSVIKSDEISLGPVLIVSPAANTVLPVRNGVTTNKTDYVKLLQVLQDAHELGICHRDVKPQNIFKDSNNRIILNDWSSGAKTGKLTDWAGTEFFYTKKDKHDPHPKDDLLALVRSVYLMYRNQQTGQVLKAIELSPLWREAIQLAEVCDYDGLREFFNRL